MRLQYFQPGVLSTGGAVTVLDKMLDWIDDAEGLLGEIPTGAIEAWRTVLVVMSLLSLSCNEGVGSRVYEKLFKLLLKLKGNLAGVKSDYKKLESELAAHEKHLQTGIKDDSKKQEVEAKIAKLPQQIKESKLKYQRLKQLSATLEANRQIIEINFTRLQKLDKYASVVSNTLKTVVGAITAGGSVTVGSAALVGAIAATPVTYGAAALAIIPAAVGFSASVIGAGAALYQAAWSAGAAGIGVHELVRKADIHPINTMFANAMDNDVLASIKARYLENGNLKKEVKGNDSWHLVQFLRELLVNLKGAAALKEELKLPVEEGLRQLLRAIYRAHASSKKELSNTICVEVIALSQTLQEVFKLDIFSVDRSANLSLDDWLMAYSTQNWLPEYKPSRISILGHSKEKFDEENRKKLQGHLEQYNAVVRDTLNQPKSPIGLPWDDWFYDLSVETLSVVYEKYKAEKKFFKPLKSAYFICLSYVPVAQNHQKNKQNPPVLSSW